MMDTNTQESSHASRFDDDARPSGWADPVREIRRYLTPARDRIRSWRNRNLENRDFQTRAAKFFLTRPFARRDSRKLFDLVAGFVYSQVLTAGVELKLFDHLAEGPLRLNEIAARLGLEPEAALRLLRASAALDLVSIDDANDGGERYDLGPLGAALRTNPGALAMIRHHSAFYEDMKDPVALLKGEAKDTRLSQLWPYAGERAGNADAEAVKRYSDLMAVSQTMVAQEILGSYDLTWARNILDIGGGRGAFLTEVAKINEDADLHLMELPPVAALARESLSHSRHGRRVHVHEGDFKTDPLPAGYDLVTLVRIVHDHDDDTVLALLKKIKEGLPPGGVVMIAEPMAGDRHSGPIADAYFGFYLLAMGSGRPRSADEIARLMNAAGLERAREVRTSLPVAARIVLAERPRRNPAELRQRSVTAA